MSPRCSTLIVLSLLIAAVVPAHSQVRSQIASLDDGIRAGGPLVTAGISRDQVRLTVLALTRQIRLEVLSQTGEPVFDSDFRPGNRLEWEAKDQRGSGLRDGIYGCIVTVEDLSGQISHRRGIFTIKDSAVSFDSVTQQAAAGSDEQENLTILQADEPSPFTLVSHDGKEGWIESASGGLTFNAGSISRNREAAPHLRLTPEGNVGIGVVEPQAKLDVAGLIRAAEGFQFSDGTILKMEGGSPVLVTEGSNGSSRTSVSAERKTARVLTTVGNIGVALAGTGSPGRVLGEEGGGPLFNTSYGQDAGPVTNGSYNAFFGYAAGGSNTTGLNNSFFGYKAGYSNTQGPSNSFFGESAGSSNTTGCCNSFFGTGAGWQNNGNYNSYFGEAAGGSTTTGNYNSFFGWNAAVSNTAGSGNSVFGFNAGLSNTTENNNTFVGAYSNGIGGITNAAAIGHRASVTQSNSLIIGSINGVNGATVDTNVGIGTTAPKGRLDVAGPVYSSAWGPLTGSGVALLYDTGGPWGMLLSYDSVTDHALDFAFRARTIDFRTGYYGNNIAMHVTDPGNVGIGTTSPTSKLTVTGNVEVKGTGNGILFPDGSALTSNSAARVRAITYLAGCDTCDVLTDADDQRTIFLNLIGAITINSVTCFSDAGSPIINLQRDSGIGGADILNINLTCTPSGTTSTDIVSAQSVLNLNDKLDFVMVSAGGVARRVTVAIKATVN